MIVDALSTVCDSILEYLKLLTPNANLCTVQNNAVGYCTQAQELSHPPGKL